MQNKNESPQVEVWSLSTIFFLTAVAAFLLGAAPVGQLCAALGVAVWVAKVFRSRLRFWKHGRFSRA